MIDFRVPFSKFAGDTFINCLASIFVFMEGLTGEEVCSRAETGVCDNCGNCAHTISGVQEKYFMIFDLVSGRSSLRCRFDGERTQAEIKICAENFYDAGTDDTIRLLFGYAGYAYNIIKDMSAVRASIDAGVPVIGRIGHGSFHVIVGYEGDTFICPDLRAESFDAFYIIGDRHAPLYTFKDGLLGVRRVMEHNAENRLWEGYIEKVGFYAPDGFGKLDAEGRKARMKRVAETMWHTFNCHNFAEVFRYPYVNEINCPKFDAVRSRIGSMYGYTHDLAWSLIGLAEQLDYSWHGAGYYGEMIELTLDQIRKNDEIVYENLCEAIRLLES